MSGNAPRSRSLDAAPGIHGALGARDCSLADKPDLQGYSRRCATRLRHARDTQWGSFSLRCSEMKKVERPGGTRPDLSPDTPSPHPVRPRSPMSSPSTPTVSPGSCEISWRTYVIAGIWTSLEGWSAPFLFGGSTLQQTHKMTSCSVTGARRMKMGCRCPFTLLFPACTNSLCRPRNGSSSFVDFRGIREGPRESCRLSRALG